MSSQQTLQPMDEFSVLGLSPALWLRADRGVLTDGAVQFTAADKSRLKVASNSTLQVGAQSFWFAFWIYLDAAPSESVGILDKTINEWRVLTDANRRVVFQMGAGGAVLNYATGNNVLATSGWTFVFGYADTVNDLARVGINNGAFAGDVMVGDTSSAANDFGVGGLSGSNFLGARMDSVAFGKSPPSGIAAIASTIRDSLYNSGSGKTYADITAAEKTDWGLVSWWDMDEPSGQRNDSHGTNHLTETFANIIDATTLNGGFETAGAGAPDDLGSWTEAEAGTSTVSRNTSDQRTGNACLAIASDASGSTASVSQAVLTVGKRYTYALWAKAAAGTPSLAVRLGSSGGTNHTISTTYTQYTLTGAASGTTAFLIANNSASATYHIDDVTLVATQILGANGIKSGDATDGDPVSTWQDQSGNGNHLLQTTVASKPTYDLAVQNSLPGVLYDGVDDMLSLASLSLGTFTVFTVFKMTGTAGLLYQHSADANANAGCYLYGTTNATINVRRDASLSAKELSANWAVDNAAKLTTHRYGGTHASHVLRINRSLQSLNNFVGRTADPGTGSVSAIWTLGRQNSGILPCNGYIFEHIVVNRECTDAEVARCEAYLKAKWGTP